MYYVMMYSQHVSCVHVYQHEDKHYAVCWLIEHEAEYKANGCRLRIVKG